MTKMPRVPRQINQLLYSTEQMHQGPILYKQRGGGNAEKPGPPSTPY